MTSPKMTTGKDDIRSSQEWYKQGGHVMLTNEDSRGNDGRDAAAEDRVEEDGQRLIDLTQQSSVHQA